MTVYRTVLGLAAAVTVVSGVYGLASDRATSGGPPSAPARPASANHAAASDATGVLTVVMDVDITASVSRQFVESSLDSFAAAVPRLVRHDGGAPVQLYLRTISPSSGSDSAALGDWFIPRLRTCANPFDQRCRQKRLSDAARRQSRARAIARTIRKLHLPRTHTRTEVLAAFAAAGAIFAATPSGSRWLVAATDLRETPQQHPEHLTVNLNGVHVAVLFACEQSIAKCQSLQRRWTNRLLRAGADPPIRFLTTQQGDLIFPARLGGGQ